MTQETGFRIDPEFIAKQNQKLLKDIETDYAALANKLKRRGVDIDKVTAQVQKFGVAVPSWGVGTGGTRFGRFPGPGEPRHVFDKIVDCATIHQLTGATPAVSLHIPWDKPQDPKELTGFARSVGVSFDAMNSNTFQDQKDQAFSYKFGSLTHTDRKVRKQAVDHNLECIAIGKTIGSKALTVWIADGGNFPGQLHFRRAMDRYMESVAEIYKSVPNDWRLFVEYKFFEPAFYSTVINDWGTALVVVQQLGPKAHVLVDLGHHAPNANIECVVSRLVQCGKLGGFHFNDGKYADDDLDAGSIKPFQLFLVFNELVDAAVDKSVKNFYPAYMIDQSHNVTDPIESLVVSTEEIVRAYAQALIVDRAGLAEHQESNDALMALRTLKTAFTTDVMPILQMARHRKGSAIDPIAVYRASGYRKQKGKERPAIKSTGGGIV